MNIVQKAKEFAIRKHVEVGHVRKYTGEPYIIHPKEVVNILKTVEHTDEMLASGWLHDTVEDTNTTLDEIGAEFGLTVRGYVRGLTDVSKPEDGNRAFRKSLDREHLSKQLPCVMTVKLADVISNAISITSRDLKFAKVYMGEMKLLLPLLKAGDTKLWNIAYNIVNVKL